VPKVFKVNVLVLADAAKSQHDSEFPTDRLALSALSIHNLGQRRLQRRTSLRSELSFSRPLLPDSSAVRWFRARGEDGRNAGYFIDCGQQGASDG
jgi:hypothetical protein